MNIEKHLRDVLRSLSAVTDIVGDRIWDEWFRTDEIPAIAFEIDNEAQEPDLIGKGGETVADVTIICRAATRAAARDLAEAVARNKTDPGTGLAGYSDRNRFKSTLESQVMVANIQDESMNDYWYDVEMSFEVQWYEGR